MQHLSDLVSSTTNALKTSQQKAVEHFQESLRDDGADWLRRIQRELRLMKLDACTEEQELALNCLQSIPISENVLRIETKLSTAMAKNQERFFRPLQEFSGSLQASNRDKQPSHNLVPVQFSSTKKNYRLLGPAIPSEKTCLARCGGDPVHVPFPYRVPAC